MGVSDRAGVVAGRRVDWRVVDTAQEATRRDLGTKLQARRTYGPTAELGYRGTLGP